MDKKVVDLLVAFAKLKGSIQSQMPPSDDLLFIEKFNCKLDVFQKISPVTFSE